MTAKNMLKTKRAISPILATLLLIVIAVAAIAVTYAWVMTYMSGAGQQAGTRIRFDSISINAASDEVTLYVRNWGTEPAVVDIVYINGANVTGAVTTEALPQTIPVDGVLLIKVNGTAAGIDFIANTWYTIKVAGPATYCQEQAKAA
ncbi:MAG: archaellin/type IV pilin N-terminal domain-containing protein [Candidatus Bathyarchaeia archaeon]